MIISLFVRRARSALGGSAVLLLLAWGCSSCGASSPVVSLETPKQLATSKGHGDHSEYNKTRRKWTRAGRIIKKLDTTMRVHATFLSPEFNAAYHARCSKMFSLSQAKQRKLKRELDQNWAKNYSFIIATATLEGAWNDFDRKNSVWNATLLNDSGAVVDAEDISKEARNATLTELFPTADHFHQIFRLAFPKTLPNGQPLVTRSTKNLSLRLAGPLGQTDLVWRLQ